MGMLMRRHLSDNEPTPVTETVEEVANTLEDKTVADLRIIAQQRGLTGISTLTKAELLDLLK
uniref:Dimeris T4 recombination endonuclease VII n=1 Tax=Siphoviridae sp. ct1mp9 TaxID=2826274 RepID=A0A8S5NAA8_9CAUD|nr:MAG TPA: dimeris T4 recombination endonuclease VII [Siphoviridae sp. ct1mp9]